MRKVIENYKSEIVVAAVFLVFAFAFNRYRVEGDGLVYGIFLEKTLGISDPEFKSPGLKDYGFYQAASAFLSMPFYFAGYAAEKVLRTKIDSQGITFRSISINVASNFYILISILLAVATLKKLRYRHQIFPVLAVLFSTYAFSAAAIMPSGNHAADIFINTLIIYLFVSWRDSGEWRYSILGAFCSVSVLFRYFNFILVFPIAFYAVQKRRYRDLLFLVVGVISVGWVIPLIFYLYNGSPVYPISAEIMEGVINHQIASSAPGFPKYALKYLLHPIHGFLIWSPVVVLSLLGLLKLPEENQTIGYALLGMFLLLVLIYGFNSDWHAGWSFSNRYMGSLFLVYVVGLSAMLGKATKSLRVLAYSLVAYSIFLFFNWNFGVIHGDWGTPGDMFRAWRDRRTYSGEKLDAGLFLGKIWAGCRYKYLF